MNAFWHLVPLAMLVVWQQLTGYFLPNIGSLRSTGSLFHTGKPIGCLGGWQQVVTVQQSDFASSRLCRGGWRRCFETEERCSR